MVTDLICPLIFRRAKNQEVDTRKGQDVVRVPIERFPSIQKTILHYMPKEQSPIH